MKVSNIFLEAASAGLAINESIANTILASLEGAAESEIVPALKAYVVVCDVCGEECGLGEVVCHDGEITCDCCGG